LIDDEYPVPAPSPGEGVTVPVWLLLSQDAGVLLWNMPRLIS
jgi:hypothetical protein